MPPDTAAVGEIGLGGELRRVSRLDVRLAEAARLGFRRLLVPAVCQREFEAQRKASRPAARSECELVPIEDLAQAVDWLQRCGVAPS